MPNGNTGSHTQFYFSESSLFLRFVLSSCDVNRVATEIKAKLIDEHRIMFYAKCILNCFGYLENSILVGK